MNPLDAAESPRGVQHNPHPPTSEQAAAIVTAAFALELGWGVLVWLAMTTGSRRGELCALQWSSVDLDRALLTIRTSIAQDGSRSWEKDTKTHQQRRIALDETTVGSSSIGRARRSRPRRSSGRRRQAPICVLPLTCAERSPASLGVRAATT